MLDGKKATLGIGLAALMFSVVNTGCYIEAYETDEIDDDGGEVGNSTVPKSVMATIDTDKSLETDPGNGVGVFIEYEQGGRWHVFTSCDTNLSGLSCYFNVIVTLPDGGSIRSFQHESLEWGDEVFGSSSMIALSTHTESGVDGMNFDTPAGANVSFEVWLDNEPESRFIYWVGGGAVHAGAPTNPIELKPSTP